MAQFKWYDIFVDLFGTILSFADPITDILTVVEFYRADHKTWFVVGLCFIILPSFFFSLINFKFFQLDEDESRCGRRTICMFGCSPFFPAFMKLRTLFVYLNMKKLPNLWRGNQIEPTDINKNPLTFLDPLPYLSAFAVVAEAAFESAPQFIIQLYVIVVQQESVTIVQMASLPVSFLSLASASTVADKLLNHHHGHLDLSVKDKVLLFVTHLFILSSRLFAVALFTVCYKWWVTSLLILHCTVIMMCDIFWIIWTSRTEDCNVLVNFWFTFCFSWLRDDWSLRLFSSDEENGENYLRRMMLLSNVLFVIENITMILLFYFGRFPHTWYSLPVTICVCLFSVLGAVMRLTQIDFLKWYVSGTYA